MKASEKERRAAPRRMVLSIIGSLDLQAVAGGGVKAASPVEL
jgi:hypothetical protein